MAKKKRSPQVNVHFILLGKHNGTLIKNRTVVLYCGTVEAANQVAKKYAAKLNLDVVSKLQAKNESIAYIMSKDVDVLIDSTIYGHRWKDPSFVDNFNYYMHKYHRRQKYMQLDYFAPQIDE